MKQYKQKEVAKLEGVEVRTIQRWKPEDLQAKGWTKHEKDGKVWYTREQDEEVDGVISTRADLEIRKLRAEIAEKEQKIEKRKRLLFQEWSDICISEYMESFAPLKDMLIEARFDNDNLDKWNEVIDKCSLDFQERCGNIYQSVDM